MELDTYIKVFSIIFPIMFGFMASFFLTIGLRGILTKRPFMISNRWFFALMAIICIPSILMPLLSMSRISSERVYLMTWLPPILGGFALLVMWYSQKGHVAYGVTDASFRESLLATLEKLQLPYEESLSTIRLTSIEVDLQVSVQAWMGTGIIKVKQRAHRSDLRKIVNAMNEYFRASSVSTNMISCVLLLVGGIIMVLLAIVVSFVWKQFPTQIG